MKYRSKEWMKEIAKFRKYKKQARGEKSGKAKFDEDGVRRVRALNYLPKSIAKRIARLWKCHPDYPYQLRQKKANGEWKKWTHLK